MKIQSGISYWSELWLLLIIMSLSLIKNAILLFESIESENIKLKEKFADFNFFKYFRKSRNNYSLIS